MSHDRSRRFRLRRGGILNVWQYDDQVFDFGGGRLLLRGTNGAGKSKTLEMLLPFVIDGDKAKITASGRHHTSLLWLMLDGYAGQNRTGYLWVEFARSTDDGRTETLTCGIGLRASDSARTATTWYFTSPRRVGVDLHLADAAGPLSMQRLRAEVETDGHFFDPSSTRRYREHVGHALFGLPLDQYEDLLRLLYWLRQPQVGEDIDPKRLAEQLVQALPQVDESAIRSAGDTFDQLEEFGEQIERQERASLAIGTFLQTYRSYASGVVGERAQAVVDAQVVERRCRRDVRRVERAIQQTEQQLAQARAAHGQAESRHTDASARIAQLRATPEARAQAELIALGDHLQTRGELAAQAGRQLADQQRRAAASALRVSETGAALDAALTDWVARARSTRAASAESGVDGSLGQSVLIVTPELARQQADSGDVLRRALEPSPDELEDLRHRIGGVRAAVKVVDEARAEAEDLRAEAERREEDSGRAEAGLARHQTRHDEAVTAVRESGESLSAALAEWLEAPAAVAVEAPEIAAEALSGFASVVADALAPVRAETQERRANSRSRLAAADEERRSVVAEREAVAAERDPRPEGPTWHRAERAHLEAGGGAPFWRLVEFADDLGEAERCAVEAALEGSGLLDAWVRPDGRVQVEVDDLFVDVRAAPSHGLARDLGRALHVDRHASDLVPASVVESVLSRVGLTASVGADQEPLDAAGPSDFEDPFSHQASSGGPDSADASPTSLVIGLDGSWRAGPLVGRTGKAAPQFIGATARAAERARRLAVLDARIEALDAAMASAREEAESCSATLAALDRWQRERPSHEPLLTAWAMEQAAAVAVDEARAELASAVRAAESARAAAATAHDALVSLGQVHELPITAVGLKAREAQLLEVLARASDLELRLDALRRELARWQDLSEAAVSEAARLEELAADYDRSQTAADTAAAELDELRATAGASIAELERRLAELAEVQADADAERAAHQSRVEAFVHETGTLGSEHGSAQRALAEATPRLGRVREALVALERVPGIITSALAPSGTAYDQWTPDDPRAILAALPDGKRADDTAVVSASQVLIASPAATYEPRIAKLADAWVAFGLGEGGEVPLVDLEAQLSGTVAANKELLSQRERQIFEEQVLGYLGDALRGVRLKAEELVTAMNAQLESVTTSQGIRVRLRWRQRDDIAADAKRAVELLGAPIGALLPSERVELRESLHRLIDSSRSEAPEESYAEHLARALDYRRWFAFSVQYHRPETGDWRDLQRKSALSQGEQKVLCYLPLFAAAAAHFTSVAGAAPHAPRFVLLDDAFPKIDARTHPLLFGLLVDLDLDFVVTSERLWGTHATVPELAIYEALRSPGERGIAQFEHRWDGHQLSSVGAGGPALGTVDD